MNSIMILFIVISTLFGGITFLVTSNIIATVVVFVLSVLYFLLIALPKLKKNEIKCKRFHECYHFINTYIVTLSIKQSSKAAYEDTLNTMPEDFKKIDDGIIDLTDEEKLSYLKSIYPFHIYSLFLNLVSIWIEEGGDILAMSTQLINETKNVEEYLSSCERLSRKKYVEFSVLWVISLAILIFLKFALKEFYTNLVNQIFFPISISAIFIFILFSIECLLNATTNIELKGWNEK